jgi:hypothetical protein
MISLQGIAKLPTARRGEDTGQELVTIRSKNSLRHGHGRKIYGSRLISFGSCLAKIRGLFLYGFYQMTVLLSTFSIGFLGFTNGHRFIRVVATDHCI